MRMHYGQLKEFITLKVIFNMSTPYVYFINPDVDAKMQLKKSYLDVMYQEIESDRVQDDKVIFKEMDIRMYSDKEYGVSFNESVRGRPVFIVGSTINSDSIIKLILAADAAKRASASEIVALIPYFGYARQDRKDGMRGSIGAKALLNAFVANGVNKIVAIDLHATQIQGFSDIPIDNIYGYDILKSTIKDYIKRSDNPAAFVSPDAGGAKRAHIFVDRISENNIIPAFGMCFKHRKEANVVNKMMYVGSELTGHDVYLIDDMADTAGTICQAAEILKEKGAANVYPVFTHAVLSGSAKDRLKNAARNGCITKIITTNTHDVRDLYDDDLYDIVDVARSLAISLYAMQTGKSTNLITNNVEKYLDFLAEYR